MSKAINKRFSIITIVAVAILSAVSLSSCNNKEDGIDGTYFGLLNVDYFTFSGTVDKDLTPSCGTAAAVDSESETSTSYNIESYYVFKMGQTDLYFNYPLGQATLFMKYVYDSSQKTTSIAPSSTSVTTCPTTDYINCNGTSGVNPECETVDGVTCGGNSAFTFVSVNNVPDAFMSMYLAPDIVFQASSGTIDWSSGFSLNTTSTRVQKADISFDMISSEGKLFEGSVYCYDN